MKLREGHEQRVCAWGTGSGAREMGVGRGRGSPLSRSSPPPIIPLTREGHRRRSHKYVQNSREAAKEERGGAGKLREGAGAGLGRLCQGALAPWVAVGAPKVPWLAAVLAEVAVALDVGAHQVAPLRWVDLPTFAVADLVDGLPQHFSFLMQV